jgi:hypothetical protein
MPYRIASSSVCAVATAALIVGASLGVAAELLTPVQLEAATTTDPSSVEAGTSFETAIVLEDATNTYDGIAAESAYIRKHHPGWRPMQQSLVEHEGRHYDLIDLIGPNGETRTIYFDITDWFGKR